MQTLSAPVSEENLVAVLQAAGWRKQDAELAPDAVFAGLSTPACRFYAVNNKDIPGAGVMRFVLDEKGQLLAHSGDMDGLAQLLRRCLPADADAATWAHVVALFSTVVYPTVMLPNDKLAQASLGSVPYQPPIKRVADGQTVLEFFAKRNDRRNLRMKATLPATGPLLLESQPIP